MSQEAYFDNQGKEERIIYFSSFKLEGGRPTRQLLSTQHHHNDGHDTKISVPRPHDRSIAFDSTIPHPPISTDQC